MADIKGLCIFSVFMAAYLSTLWIVGFIPFAEDNAASLVVALFLPYIWLRWYLYFIGFRLALFALKYPVLFEIISTGTSFYNVEHPLHPLPDYVNHAALWMIFIYLNIVQPFIIKKALDKAGIYRRAGFI